MSSPGESEKKDSHNIDTHTDDQFDEARLAAWVKQAKQLVDKRLFYLVIVSSFCWFALAQNCSCGIL